MVPQITKIMKHLIVFVILPLAILFKALAQDIYKGERGKVKFFSDALLEDIEAESSNVTSALNMSTGEVVALIPIKSFVFDKSLMQEHFNENYLESDRYPDATFSGKVLQIPVLKPGEAHSVTLTGKLTIHGVTQPRDIAAVLRVNDNGSITVTAKFKIKIEDHKVKVPNLLFENIAEVVEVTLDLNLKHRDT
jgi:hypothetical protein